MAGPTGVVKKKKHKEEEIPEEVSPQDQYPFLAWMIANRQNIGYGLALVLALAFAVSRYSASAQVQAESDYIAAAMHHDALTTGLNTEKAAEDLQTILETRPELEAKYAGDLAHYFLKYSDVAAAQAYAENTLARQDASSPFRQYSATTLLIEQGNYDDALTSAQALDQELTDDSGLRMMNLIRIGFLTEEVNGAAAAKQAWSQVLEKLDAHPEIAQNFTSGGITLKDYINRTP